MTPIYSPLQKYTKKTNYQQTAMTLFRNKKQERFMEMIQSYRPTSKASLKQFCLLSTRGDIEKASQMYDFLIKDMEELPMFDPVPPNWMDNTKSVVSGIIGFFKDNQDTLAQGYEIIRSIAASRGKTLPSIGNAAEIPPSPLPPIN